MNTTTLDKGTVRRWKQYTEYTESCIEWIERLPAHWRVGKLGAVSSVKARLGWKGLKADEYVDEGFIFLSTPNIKDTAIDFENANYITAERYYESPEIMLQEGDVLIAKDGSTLGITNVVRHLPAPSTVNSSVAVIRPSRSLNSVFLSYLFKSHWVQSVIQRMKGGMGVPHLFQADLRKFLVLLPPLPEQRAIAAFLDRQTARIDALIGHKERLIELLEEKRQAVISHAVTRGLDPATPLKDSGLPWLGMVPKHWTVRRLKFLLATPIEQGWSPVCDNRTASDEEWAVLKVGCVNGQEFDSSEHKALPEGTPPDTRYVVRENDILMSRGNTRELVGNAALVRGVRPRLLLSDLLYRFQVDDRKALPEFVVRSLRSSLIRFQIELVAEGSSPSMKKIGQQDIRELVILLPPVEEQVAIVRWVRSTSEHIDRVASRTGEGIARLQEYRTALISAAVTGQIDVRGEVTP